MSHVTGIEFLMCNETGATNSAVRKTEIASADRGYEPSYIDKLAMDAQTRNSVSGAARRAEVVSTLTLAIKSSGLGLNMFLRGVLASLTVVMVELKNHQPSYRSNPQPGGTTGQLPTLGIFKNRFV